MEFVEVRCVRPCATIAPLSASLHLSLGNVLSKFAASQAYGQRAARVGWGFSHMGMGVGGGPNVHAIVMLIATKLRNPGRVGG